MDEGRRRELIFNYLSEIPEGRVETDDSVAKYVHSEIMNYARKEGFKYVIYNRRNHSDVSGTMYGHVPGQTDQTSIKHNRKMSKWEASYYLEAFRTIQDEDKSIYTVSGKLIEVK